MLEQIPLIFTAGAPQPVQLPLGYQPAPQLQQTQVTKDNLDAWIQECSQVESRVKSYRAEDKAKYEEWKQQTKRLAPGYSIQLQPTKKPTAATTTAATTTTATTHNLEDLDI